LDGHSRRATTGGRNAITEHDAIESFGVRRRSERNGFAVVRNRVRIQPYIFRDLQRSLRSWAAAQNVTESAVVESALLEYLDDGRADQDLIGRRLDIMSRAMGRLQSDVELIADALGRYVRHVFIPAVTKLGPEHEEHVQTAYRTFLRGILDGSGVPGRFITEVRNARFSASSRPPSAAPARGR
jgi:hypothetical protein